MTTGIIPFHLFCSKYILTVDLGGLGTMSIFFPATPYIRSDGLQQNSNIIVNMVELVMTITTLL